MAQQPRPLNPAGSPEQLYGAQLRARRTALGLSQDALATRANFTGAVIGKWEKGQSLPDEATAALLDRTLAIGDARLKVVKRIVRCAATNVDPETAARDLDIPHTLMRSYGHADCGVYAEVIADGSIAVGDAIRTKEPPLPDMR